MAKGFTKEEDVIILERKRQGATLDRIAIELTRCRSNVGKRYAELVGRAPMPRWTPAEHDRLVEAVNVGMSLAEASRHVGTRTADACSRYAVIRGIGFRRNAARARAANDRALGETAETRAWKQMCADGSLRLLRAYHRYYLRHVV